MGTEIRQSVAELASPSADAADHVKYLEAVELYGPAMARLARAYEADVDRRRDLLQELQALGVVVQALIFARPRSFSPA